MAQLTARELSREVRNLARSTEEEKNKPAIVRFDDDASDMKYGLQQAYENAQAAMVWYNNNDLVAVVAALADTDNVTGTTKTKAELVADYVLLTEFITWAETQLGTIYHVPESLSATEAETVEEPPV